jgi:hypothetical protein
MTVDQSASASHGDVSPWEDPQQRRIGATLLIACGITTADLRGFAEEPGNPYAVRDLALAGEVESLTARGLTKRHAQRARGYNLSDESIGVMARLHLAEGHTAAQVRADKSRPATLARARYLARVADAMDAQAATTGAN